MAITQIGILYATDSKVLFGVIVPAPPHTDADLDGVLAPPKGSPLTLLKVPFDPALAGLYTHEDVAKAAIEKATGVKPPNGRCVVFGAQNIVVDTTIGCPVASGLPNLMFHDQAIVGDRWDGTQFVRKFAVADAQSKTVSAIVEAPIDTGPTIDSTKIAVPLASTAATKVGDVLPAKPAAIASTGAPA